MKKKFKKPILKEINHLDIPINRNELRDKYPNVDFKDKDIEKYDYESYDRHLHILKSFVEQYNVKDILVPILFNERIIKRYMFNVKPNLKWKSTSLVSDECYFLDYNSKSFSLNNINSGEQHLSIDIKDKNNFNFEINNWTKTDFLFDIEINPDLTEIKKDYISFFINELLKEYNDETIIYKHPNGYVYYTKDHCIHKEIDIKFNREKEMNIEFKLEEFDVVEPFKKYYGVYNKVYSMHKKSKQISLDQLKIELISLCKNTISKNIQLDGEIYPEDNLRKYFNEENVQIKYRPFDRNYDEYVHFTNYKENKKDYFIEEVPIYKKDKSKLIDSYSSLDEIDDVIKKDILDFLIDVIGENLDLSIMDKDLEYFVYHLNLDVYDNEELTKDYFYYNCAYDFGRYKIDFRGGRYIKDQSICDMKILGIDIYKK